MAILCSFPKWHPTFAARASLMLCAVAGLCGSSALLAADSKAAAAPKLTAAQIVDKHVAAKGGPQAWRGLQRRAQTWTACWTALNATRSRSGG